ncbi:thiamine biosynthesis protein ThiS [Spirosoma linguale DSM 74]|uniref:Thiamine biosynthesis protein ThiS n=2 Tax=Spirosoma TaxID=107 RepID=D2QUP7_SPILD|nr:thiamine biosynthesis protein ThiS [Spirosoma linguale DSM 74]
MIMTLTVNNQSVEIADSASLRTLLTQLAIANQKGIAVAVNNAIVPRATWEQFVLSGNEKITILQATQGG